MNCRVRPLAMEEFAGVIAIDSSVAAPTVKVVEPVIAPDAALIVVEPTFTAVARPPGVIVATVLPEEAQVTEVVRSLVLLSV